MFNTLSYRIELPVELELSGSELAVLRLDELGDARAARRVHTVTKAPLVLQEGVQREGVLIPDLENKNGTMRRGRGRKIGDLRGSRRGCPNAGMRSERSRP